jgi:hypothetical protein
MMDWLAAKERAFSGRFNRFATDFDIGVGGGVFVYELFTNLSDYCFKRLFRPVP